VIAMKKRILVTGATGFVVPYIIPDLIKNGYEVVCLARSKGGKSAQKRVDESLSFVDPFVKGYSVIEGDITKPNLGIVGNLKTRFDEFFHGAASISFRDKDAELTKLTNVQGTKNVLDFCDKEGIPKIDYLSTLYICGRWKSLRFFENDLYKDQEFKNPYEQTKFEAEKLVQEFQQKHRDASVSIYRLGIVVGDSKTGKANNFSGYYNLAQLFVVLKNRVLEAIKVNPEPYRKSGFYVDEGNGNGSSTLVFPVRIPCHPRQSVNLVTVDYVRNIICSLMRNEENRGIFHITNQDPPTVEWLFDASLSFLGLSGYHLVDLAEGQALSKSILDVAMKEILYNVEVTIWNKCRAYLPYLAGEPVFDDFNARLATGMLHPRISEETIKTLLSYALRSEFGRRKVTEAREVAMAAS